MSHALPALPPRRLVLDESARARAGAHPSDGRSRIELQSAPGEKTSPRTHRSSARIVTAIAVVVAAGMAFAQRTSVTPSQETSAVATTPIRVSIDRDGLRYTYNAALDIETLWSLDAPPADRRDLMRDRPEDARRLRRLLEAEIGVGSLDELRGPHRTVTERLRALGYL